ncbi:hypothetical protein EOD41_07335 [Mucilaginibacter limnophilus]|uniref:Uncharacterized protein n=1 Tax=Mucilaginibacter limnophilus TaxID=1932778 RepID=A0A3S2Y4F1_9SPHI|nr:hypothetical protein [Mucilaginibacter limnophilus]RVU01765.1 hypothetical protein EOD41_07335 [Mucilaginibacter limnophilus]
MKNLFILLILCAVFTSCKKFNGHDLQTDKAETLVPGDTTDLITVIPADAHTFTDVQICYNDHVFLLENGRLKRLNGTALVDVPVPAGFYDNFNPMYLAISKDFTFYLRGTNGIKIMKSGKLLKFYQVGQPPLQDFTEQTFGNLELNVDEADHSIIFGTLRGGFDPILFSLHKITQNGQLGLIPFSETEDAFITCFTTGAPGDLWWNWLGVVGDLYYGGLYHYTLDPNSSFNYTFKEGFRNSPDNHQTIIDEGPIDSVFFAVMAMIEVSKDAKTIYFKTGEYNPEGVAGVGSIGNVYQIKDGIVTKIAQNVENKRIAISNDGKALYLAGKGLTKIELD